MSPYSTSVSADYIIRSPLGNSVAKEIGRESFAPVFWSGLRGSNPPPRPWQGRALPNELNPQVVPPVGIEPTTILWVIPAVVRGILMGYLFRAFKKSTKPSIIAIETCISSLVVTLLNTGALLLDNMMYGYTTYYAIFVAIPMRLVAGILTALVFSLMLPTILNSLNNHVKL